MILSIDVGHVRRQPGVRCRLSPLAYPTNLRVRDAFSESTSNQPQVYIVTAVATSTSQDHVKKFCVCDTANLARNYRGLFSRRQVILG